MTGSITAKSACTPALPPSDVEASAKVPASSQKEPNELVTSPRIGKAGARGSSLSELSFNEVTGAMADASLQPAPAVDASLEPAPAVDASLEPSPEPEPAAEDEEEMAPEEIYSQLRALCASINSKLSDTQAELHEHKMVKTALEPLEDERKCFRLLGSVLVEKTKGEVLPAILEQMSSLEKLAVSYGEQLQDAQKRLREHVATHEPTDEQSQKADEIDAQIQRRSRSGVLV